MNEHNTAKNWNKLVARKLDANGNVDESKTRELAKTLFRKQEMEDWLDWQPDATELARLQTIFDNVSLLFNKTAEAKWPEATIALKQACRGDGFPWPLLRRGLSAWVQQPVTPPIHQKKTSFLHSHRISIKLPANPKQIWLAIGDETGDWDYGSKVKNDRGLVLVLARLDTWQRVFGEQINGMSVAERMQKPLHNLPADCEKSHFHHVKDAFNLNINGISPDLLAELQANLGWLAEHPDLITLGFSASYQQLHQHFSHSQDASTVLAKAYAVLLAYVMPFLQPSDVLLLGFEGRSEAANGIATTRSDFPQTMNSKNRADMNMRGFLSALRDVLVSDLSENWPSAKPWSERFDLALLNNLVRLPHLNLRGPSSNAWKGLADMGPSLLKVRQNQNWSSLLQFASTPNVHFLDLAVLSK